MKTIVATLVSVILIGGASAKAPTATPPSAAASAGMPESAAKQKLAIENHITEVRAQLQITAAEEPQWDAVAAAMRDSALQTDKAIDKRRILGGSATAVDSLNAYAEIAQAHADGVKNLAMAFTALYESLPADQKKLADVVFAHHPHDGKTAAK
jgi:hypothetical protein